MEKKEELFSLMYSSDMFLNNFKNRFDLGLIDYEDFKEIQYIYNKSNYLISKKIENILKKEVK